MRASVEYSMLLDKVATGKDGRRIGYLGDQTLYAYLFALRPDLFHQLPCEWNRQISGHFGFHNSSVHECPRRCGILHANFQPFKCIAWMLQAEPSCTNWKAFYDVMNDPPSKTHTCPKAAAPMRKIFKSAIYRFFADCCTPDGVVFDALGSPTLAEAEATKQTILMTSQKAGKAKARGLVNAKTRGASMAIG